MSYSDDPATSDKDQVRFWVGDTDAANEFLNDAEIAFLISNETNLLLAASKAARSIAAQLSRQADTKIGSSSEQLSKRAEAFLKLADTLAEDAISEIVTPFAGGISQSDKLITELDSDRVIPNFDKKLHDNPDIADLDVEEKRN